MANALVGVTALALLASLALIPSWWRGAGGLQPAPAYWCWSLAAWRAFWRQLPLQTVAGNFMMAAYFVPRIAPAGPGADSAALTFAAAWIVLALTAIWVAVTARPRLLVPPQLRTQASYLQDLRAERASHVC